MTFPDNLWALILGGSSGFGLATAHKLSAHGMNIIIVHRDRRGNMKRIDPEFDQIRERGVDLLTFNADALDADSREQMLGEITEKLGSTGRIRLLLHSIAFGNLRALAPPIHTTKRQALLDQLASELGTDTGKISEAFDKLFAEGFDALAGVASPPEYSSALLDDTNMANTIYNMGTSLLSWTQGVMGADLFADDARILGLTSEGNEVAWRGYAAVGAAKLAMESLARSMAVELAPYGIRTNIIQAGVTETAASALIPGIERMKAHSRIRNPFQRLTQTSDIANFIYLMCTDEAAWVNGALLRVDGGEHISGGVE